MWPETEEVNLTPSDSGSHPCPAARNYLRILAPAAEKQPLPGVTKDELRFADSVGGLWKILLRFFFRECESPGKENRNRWGQPSGEGTG